MTIAAIEQQMAAAEQQTATVAQQAATPAQQAAARAQLPRLNHRIMTNFADYQVENIRILKEKTGSTDNSVLRSAIDTLAFLNGLPTETDPSYWVNNYIVNLQGGSHGR